MNWGYHIKRLREDKGISQGELARKASLGRSHISRIELGAYQGVKQETFEKLAKGLNLSPSELSREVYGQPSPIPKETSESILERLRGSMASDVPIYEEFTFHAAGAVEAVDYVPVGRDRARGRNLEGYFVKGKCLEPDIKDGDVIIIDRDGQVDSGNIVACLVKDELHIARLRKIADDVYLENNHGRMKLEDCQVIAPVVEIRRRLK